MAAKKKRMQDYGFKGIMVYIKEDEYQAMRRYCFDNELKHSPYVRSLVVENLTKQGALKKR